MKLPWQHYRPRGGVSWRERWAWVVRQDPFAPMTLPNHIAKSVTSEMDKNRVADREGEKKRHGIYEKMSN